MAHPDVVEASVIGVPDPRWDERPLACVVRKSGSTVDAAALAAFLAEQVAKWQVPERWSFIDEVPKTQRRQVRQEGAARPARQGRAHRRVARLMGPEQERIAAAMRRDAKPSGAEPRPPRRSCSCATARAGSRSCSRAGRRSSRSTVVRGCSPVAASIPTTTPTTPTTSSRPRSRAAAREAKEEAGVDVDRRNARPPLELDDARDLTQALRDVVLRR